ncbi:hypothetical protein [Azorhizobium doebereinerae]|uniref:hypothetical protein n=1 Tax=Azorhizobium doebereinerae TaxID=281091 RepID=UPI0012EB79CC|nr:hypothetical protein [Azorhizobium doebereinerae]
MLHVDFYTTTKAGTSKIERKAVVYKSARAAKRVIYKASKTIESRRLICEDDISEVILQRIDAEGYLEVGAHVIESRLG